MDQQVTPLHSVGDKARVSAIYGSLQGRLAQIFKPGSANDVQAIKEQVRHFHTELTWLSEVIEGADLKAYHVTEVKVGDGRYYELNEFRQQLNAVIMLLYRLYFADERVPFGGEPQVVVSQQQSQQQHMTTQKVIIISLTVTAVVTVGFYFLVRLFNLAV